MTLYSGVAFTKRTTVCDVMAAGVTIGSTEHGFEHDKLAVSLISLLSLSLQVTSIVGVGRWVRRLSCTARAPLLPGRHA